MEDKIIYKNNETPIPKEILEYYKDNGYRDKMIPLNAEMANEIADILRARGIDV